MFNPYPNKAESRAQARFERAQIAAHHAAESIIEIVAVAIKALEAKLQDDIYQFDATELATALCDALDENIEIDTEIDDDGEARATFLREVTRLRKEKFGPSNWDSRAAVRVAAAQIIAQHDAVQP